MTKPSAFRAVFDTNVIITALKSKNPNSPTVELLRRWGDGEFTLLYCEDLQAEYEEKFFTRNTPLDIQAAFLRNLFELGEHIDLTPAQIQPLIPDDPDDDMVIACAIVGQATHPEVYLLGLTATPTYTDEKKRGWLKKLFPQDIIYEVKSERLVAERVLAKPIFEEPMDNSNPNMTHVSIGNWALGRSNQLVKLL